MIDKIEVGKRIAELRKNLGYSQAALAERLNVSGQAVLKWETGQVLPDIETLLDISWICQISLNALLEGDGYISPARGMERGLQHIRRFLICPQCGKGLEVVNTSLDKPAFACANGHSYNLEGIPATPGIGRETFITARSCGVTLCGSGHRCVPF